MSAMPQALWYALQWVPEIHLLEGSVLFAIPHRLVKDPFWSPFYKWQN